jgi:4-hydroxybenzoate polyprenyltransferase
VHSRWWTYQRERFPVLVHGPVIAVVSLSALCFSRLLRGHSAWPEPPPLLVAAACCFLFFLQLRIFDEWKDYDDDRRFRPYRPVPRGLVTLDALRRLWLGTAVAQLILTAWLSARLLPFLLLVWAYMALMGKEFFVRSWLKAHPVAYLGSHQVILPLIYLFATACDWVLHPAPSWTGIACFLLAGSANGVVFEIGRKIRAPQDEEFGVETYSALWGRRNAVLVWVAAMVASAAMACLAAAQIGFLIIAFWVLAAGAAPALAIAARFLRQPLTRHAAALENVSGAWTILLNLSLGPLPLGLLSAGLRLV